MCTALTWRIIVLLSFAGTSAGQVASFQNPISGFVYLSGSRSLRPILGVAGAMALGPVLPVRAEFASVAPGGTWGLIRRGHSTEFLNGLSTLSPMASPAPGLIEDVDRAAWSPDGTCAVLYSSALGKLQRVQVSGGAVAADPAVDVSFTSAVAALAIDLAGTTVAVGITGSEGSGVYLLRVGSALERIGSLANPAALTFDQYGRLYVADVESERIWAFDNGAGFEFTEISAPGGGSLNPVGMAVAGNGQLLVLAESTTNTVRVYDIASRGLTQTIALDLTPRQLEPLSSASTFLLNSNYSREWLMILDARQTPVVSFVPAIREDVQ